MTRIMPAAEISITYLTAAAVTAAGSLLLAASSSIDSDHRLILYCLAGGIGGGVVAVMMFPQSTVRLNAFKWLGSSILSALFAPALCRYLAIQDDLIYTLAMAGGCGLFSWGSIYIITPMVQKAAAAMAKFFIRDKMPGND